MVLTQNSKTSGPIHNFFLLKMCSISWKGGMFLFTIVEWCVSFCRATQGSLELWWWWWWLLFSELFTYLNAKVNPQNQPVGFSYHAKTALENRANASVYHYKEKKKNEPNSQTLQKHLRKRMEMNGNCTACHLLLSQLCCSCSLSFTQVHQAP